MKARLLSALFVLCVCLKAQQTTPRPLDWKTVLDWLPTDTQTLVVASTPFTIPKPEPNDDRELSSADLLRDYALGRLGDFGVMYQPLIGHVVAFAVAGVRDFHSFDGLGLGPYDGCAVIAFSRPLGSGFDTALVGLSKQNDFGATVYTVSVDRGGSRRDQPEDLDLFVTLLNPSTVVVATDRGSLHTLLERRMSVVSERAFPRDLPEWKAVDTKAPAWALRHYRRIYDPEKKVSVISLGPLENKLGDDSAVGLVYNAPSSGVSQTLYYLSSNRRAIEIARGRWEWEDEGLSAPTVDRISSGVFRVVAHPRSSDAIGSFILLLLAALGFEIAL